MEKTKTVGQIYAYIVCLISIVATIVTIGVILNAIFDYTKPTNSNSFRFSNNGRDLTSFETYKATGVTDKNTTTTQISDAELRVAYQDARTSQIDTVKYEAVKAIVTSGLVLLVALGLFWSHWRLAKSYTAVV